MKRAIDNAYARPLVAVRPPDFRFSSVLGIRPHPPKPPRHADSTLAPDSAYSALLLSRRSISASGSGKPVSSATTLRAKSVSSAEMSAIDRAAGKMILKVSSVKGGAGARPGTDRDGSDANPPRKRSAPKVCASVGAGAAVSPAPAVVRMTATNDDGMAVNHAGSAQVIEKEIAAMTSAGLNAAVPQSPAKMASCDWMSKHPNPLRKPCQSAA